MKISLCNDRKNISSLPMLHFLKFLLSAVVFLPTLTLAHETQEFRISGNNYKFVVGSLNEPVIIDDKSGVELTVTRMTGTGSETAVEGLDQTLKVELSAGDKTKELPLTTQFGKPGAYKAVFFPTVQTTIAYRIFGTLEGSDIDLTFECNPAGHPATADDRAEVTISGNVTRTLKRGSFGCPQAKAELGFPEPSATMVEVNSIVSDTTATPWELTAVILSTVSLLLAFSAFFRRRKLRVMES